MKSKQMAPIDFYAKPNTKKVKTPRVRHHITEYEKQSKEYKRRLKEVREHDYEDDEYLD